MRHRQHLVITGCCCLTPPVQVQETAASTSHSDSASACSQQLDLPLHDPTAAAAAQLSSAPWLSPPQPAKSQLQAQTAHPAGYTQPACHRIGQPVKPQPQDRPDHSNADRVQHSSMAGNPEKLLTLHAGQHRAFMNSRAVGKPQPVRLSGATAARSVSPAGEPAAVMKDSWTEIIEAVCNQQPRGLSAAPPAPAEVRLKLQSSCMRCVCMIPSPSMAPRLQHR